MEGFLVCTGKNRTDNNSMPRAVFWYVGGLFGIHLYKAERPDWPFS